MAQLVGMLSHRLQGCGLDSWSGHIPRLWVQSLVESAEKREERRCSVYSVRPESGEAPAHKSDQLAKTLKATKGTMAADGSTGCGNTNLLRGSASCPLTWWSISEPDSFLQLK